MRSKRLVVVSGAVLAALLLLSAIGATVVFAQDDVPQAEPGAPLVRGLGDRVGPGRAGRWGMLEGRDWTRFDVLADGLGLTPEELFAELHDGKTLEEIAEAQGVDLEALQAQIAADLQTEREQAMRDAIAEAVEDGTMSEEQAEWMLEGLDKGFLPGLRGFHGLGAGRLGRGPARGQGCPPAEESVITRTSA